MKAFAVLVSNCAGKPELYAKHGLSLFIRYGKNEYLFDTGQDELFIANSSFMNLKLENIKFAALSHYHSDHIGGIPFLSKHFSMVSMVCNIYHPEFTQEFKLPALKSHVVKSVLKVNDECFLIPTEATFNSETFTELSMVVGKALFVGCGHSGIENILEVAKEYSDITTVAGGFHNFDVQIEETKKCAENLFLSGVKRIVFLHCSSLKSVRYFEDAGIECFFGKVGNNFRFE
ncbi:MAG: MBL fold metallo-hydrolase [bacterium]